MSRRLRTRPARHRFLPQVETLESRRLLAGDIVFNAATGKVDVTGTDFDDEVRVYLEEGQLVVELTHDPGTGSETHEVRLDPAAVRKVRFTALDGDDVFINDTWAKTKVWGGPGNDYIEGGYKKDKAYGGPGDDILIGFKSRDYLYGNSGNDFLFGLKGKDYLKGGKGDDQLFGGPGRDSLYDRKGTNVLDPSSDGPLATVAEPYASQKLTDYINSGSSDLSALEQEIVNLVNQERQARGLAPLSVNSRLVSAAQQHAGNMARYNQMSHTLPQADLPNLVDRLNYYNYDYRAAGENIAWNYRSADAVMTAWMNSPGHRANILNPNFTEIGVGVRYNSRGEPYYCQVFGRRA